VIAIVVAVVRGGGGGLHRRDIRIVKLLCVAVVGNNIITLLWYGDEVRY
jgi:hypothetical protein